MGEILVPYHKRWDAFSSSYTQSGNFKLLFLNYLFIKKPLRGRPQFCYYFFLAVRSSMPGFHQKMKDTLRTEAQGADTVVWLAVSSEVTKLPSGLFFQGKVARSYAVWQWRSLSCLNCRIPIWPGRGWSLDQATDVQRIKYFSKSFQG